MDGRSAELVTVIVPAYNASATIDETLLSIRGQTHAALEIIVVDDGSTDETCALVERHAAEDSRVVLLSQSNGGVAKARNLALDHAHGRYVAPVDADDLWRPEKIARQLSLLRERGPGTTLVYTWYVSIDGDSRVRQVNRPSHEGQVLPMLCTLNFVGHASSPLMPTQAVLDAGGYDPSLRARAAQGCEDWKLYLALADRGEFAVVKSVLTGYRQVGQGMSGDIAQMLRSHYLVMSEFEREHSGYARELRDGIYRMSDYYVKEALKAKRYAAAARELRRLSLNDPRVSAYLLYCTTRRLRWKLQNRFFNRNNVLDDIDPHPHFLGGWRQDARIAALVGADDMG